MGGRAKASKMTKEERTAHAMKMVRARNLQPSEKTHLLKKHGDIQGRGRTRMLVRMRDNFTCKDCGAVRTPEMAKKEGKRLFDVHHLNGLCGKKSRGYDKEEDMDGLVTLCHKCHFNRPEHSGRKLDKSTTPNSSV